MTLQTNWFSKRNAEKLAANIEAYWARQGGAAFVYASPGTDQFARSLYVVRSNLVNGMPPVNRGRAT